MIVCKIMADFNSPEGKFGDLFNSLVPLGAIKCPGDSLFFASPLDPIDKKKIKRILKKCGYQDSVIVEYGVGNPPRETPEINGWVFDFIVQNAITRLGRENRDAIKDGMRQLDEIDGMIAKQLEELPDEPNGDPASEDEEAED